MRAGWAIKANFPNLNSGRVFRFDWFTVFLQFLTAMFITTALMSKLISQVRPPMVGGPGHRQSMSQMHDLLCWGLSSLRACSEHLQVPFLHPQVPSGRMRSSPKTLEPEP